jgi:multicomponent Na+:H+ antiporter subunit E
LRVFFVNAINLQPGTVGVRIDGDRLRVHALDQSMPVEENLRDLEERVAGLFGVELGP